MDIEAKTLDFEADPIEIEAGIDVFTKYSSANILETLSGGDILKWELVKGLPYDTVYVKLLMNKDKREFEKNYRELMMAKNKVD